MKKLIAFVLCACLAVSVAACSPDKNTQEPVESQSQPSNANPSVSEPSTPPPAPPEPEKEYEYYSYTTAKGRSVPLASIRWNENGGFSVRWNDTILFVDRENNLVKTFTPVEREWDGITEELRVLDWAGAGLYDLVWNDRYALARFEPYRGGETSSVEVKDGKPTLVDAAIYDMDGKLVKIFPSSYDEGVQKRWGDALFARHIYYRTTFYWLTEDVLAINSGDAIWMYSVSKDEFKPVADYTRETLSAFRKDNAEYHGASDTQCWVDGEKLYYALEEAGGDIGNEYGAVYSLWRVDWDSPPVRLSGDRLFNEFRVTNGRILAINYRNAQVGADWTWTPNIEWLDEQTGEYIACGGAGADWAHFVIRGDLFAYMSYIRETPEGELIKAIHCWDAATGTEQTYEPMAPAGFQSGYWANMLDVFPKEDGVILYYYVEEEPVEALENRAVSLVVHDTTTGTATFTSIDGRAELSPGMDLPTHFLEENRDGQVRIRPFDEGERP